MGRHRRVGAAALRSEPGTRAIGFRVETKRFDNNIPTPRSSSRFVAFTIIHARRAVYLYTAVTV